MLRQNLAHYVRDRCLFVEARDDDGDGSIARGELHAYFAAMVCRKRIKRRVAGASAPSIAAKDGRSPANSASSMPSEAASSTSYQPGTSTVGKPISCARS